jgi:hypothetical protein
MNGFGQKCDYAKDFLRKGAKRCRVSKNFLCDFAPLREKAKVNSKS